MDEMVSMGRLYGKVHPWESSYSLLNCRYGQYDLLHSHGGTPKWMVYKGNLYENGNK